MAPATPTEGSDQGRESTLAVGNKLMFATRGCMSVTLHKPMRYKAPPQCAPTAADSPGAAPTDETGQASIVVTLARYCSQQTWIKAAYDMYRIAQTRRSVIEQLHSKKLDKVLRAS